MMLPVLLLRGGEYATHDEECTSPYDQYSRNERPELENSLPTSFLWTSNILDPLFDSIF